MTEPSGTLRLPVSDRFVATEPSGGPWSAVHQQAGPPSALLARAVELVASVRIAGAGSSSSVPSRVRANRGIILAMKSYWNHVQINVDPANRDFYRELFSLLGWENWHEDAQMLGMGVEGKGSFWFASAPGKRKTDYDQLGVNHLGVRVKEQKDVDAVAAFLKRKDVPPLFGTPRHRPEFAEGEGQTYYQVMFGSPDNVLLEVVYIGPKAG